jgi:hypothetical protein
MSASGVDLDRVAKALGVSTDAGIVDELSPYALRLHLLSDVAGPLAGQLAGAVPDAAAALRDGATRFKDAYEEVRVVMSAAEDHVRGVR